MLGSQLKVCTENATVTAGLFLYRKSRDQLLGTPSEEMWFPNESGMLSQKSWNFPLCHGTWWMVWVFPKLFPNLAARRLGRPFQFFFQFCILLDASLKSSRIVQSLVRAGRFIIYFDSHQLILSNSTHYGSIWQVLLWKSFSFFFLLWVRLLYLLSCLPSQRKHSTFSGW